MARLRETRLRADDQPCPLLVTPRKSLAIAKLIGALAAEVMAQAAVRAERVARGIAGLPSAVDLN